MPNLCYKCHDGVAEEMSTSNVHAPATKDCFLCHDPHNAKESYLLSETKPTLCYTCHESLETSVKTATVVHNAISIDKSCSNCHASHGSENSKVLKAGQKELCLSCHNKEYNGTSGKITNIKLQLETAKSVHGPVNDGCSMCHDPHSSENQHLLNDNFPIGAYAPATKSNFLLCFNCHNSELIALEKTETVTNFRDGDRNMHYLHTNGKRGRNCTTCHNMHASENEHLIENTVKYGKWDMPIKFVLLDNGGSCFPGCHAELKYERKKIFKK